MDQVAASQNTNSTDRPNLPDASSTNNIPLVQASQATHMYPSEQSTLTNASSANDHLLPLPPKETLEDDQPRTSKPEVSKLALSSILGGWIVAVILAVSHHLFLSNVDSKMVVDTSTGPTFVPGSQFFVTTLSTFLMRGVVTSLTIGASGAITQMAWRAPSKRAIRIAQLDNIFQLPSVPSLPSVLFSSLLPSIFLLLLLSIFTNALELVTIFAPNAITIVAGRGNTRLATVPSLNLSSGTALYGTISGTTPPNPAQVNYTGATTYLISIVRRAITSPTETRVLSPAGCNIGCNYTITYQAPALRCRDLSPDNFTLPEVYDPFSKVTIYKANSTVWFLSNDTTPYIFQAEWVTPYGSGQIHDHGGVYCEFFDAAHYISASFSGTAQPVITTDIITGNVLVGRLPSVICPCTDTSSPCCKSALMYRAISDTFAQALSGTIAYYDAASNDMISQDAGVDLVPLFTTVNHTYYTVDISFLNLSQKLESIFTNVTMRLLADSRDTVQVEVTFIDAEHVWNYNVTILWGIYLPTLAAFGFCAMRALWYVLRDGTVDSTFSNFLVATRWNEIDDIATMDMNRLRSHHLHLQKDDRGRRVFKVDRWDSKAQLPESNG